MTTEIPPDWVLLEAAKGFKWLTGDAETLRFIYTSRKDPEIHGYRALCAVIEKYEKPPADRKLLCAQEAVNRRTQYDKFENVIIQAIELYEEGFGK